MVHRLLPRFLQYWSLTKPRVTQLAVFCAMVGMFLATPSLPHWPTVLWATAGIWLLASAAFAMNGLFERAIDARMSRTHHRPLARGDITVTQTIVFALSMGSIGIWLLYVFVNALTMWLTLATFLGYAVVYTLILKPITPQNIVIGGLSGAMPPALGWAAVTNTVSMEAWLLVLIIFMWTPPHFWALALYRHNDYAKSGLPMLPTTHGIPLTQCHIGLYTIACVATSLLPFAVGMSGWLYLSVASLLGIFFLRHAWQVYRYYSDQKAQHMFVYSIVYLAVLFSALLVDHYL